MRKPKTKFKAVVVAKKYSVEVSKMQMLAVLRTEDERLAEPGYKTLLNKLEALGATDVEYDGHFGEFFYFTASKGLTKILEAISKHVSESVIFHHDLACRS